MCIDVSIECLCHFKGHTFDSDVLTATVWCVRWEVGGGWVGFCVYSCQY